jgi:sigma-54-interacting transcriptional regulator
MVERTCRCGNRHTDQLPVQQPVAVELRMAREVPGVPQPTLISIAAFVSPIPGAEWQFLQRAHPNVLLAGTPTAVSSALAALHLSVRQPVVTWGAAGPLHLPSLPCSGTLILRDVDMLDREDQERLTVWLEHVWGKVQVVSTTRVPLFPLVERGDFLDTLYYRLNFVYLGLTADGARDRQPG